MTTRPTVPSLSPRARRQGGFTLFEMTAAIGIAAILLTAFYQISATAAENRRLARAVDGFMLVSEALYNYRMQERRWPSAMADLNGYAPNLSSGLRNGFGQGYTLTLTNPDPQDLIAPINIGTTLPSEDIAENVVRQFHGRGTHTGTTASVEVPIPGHEPAREALLARDGTRGMSGDLDMDSNDIEDIDDIDARTITIGNVTINESRLQTLAQAAALNCSGTQRVSIAGGSASCVAVASTPTSSYGSQPPKKPDPEEPVEPEPDEPKPVCPPRPPSCSLYETSYSCWSPSYTREVWVTTFNDKGFCVGRCVTTYGDVNECGGDA